MCDYDKIKVALEDIDKRVTAIEKIMFQIKWTLAGGLFVFLMSTVGAKELLLKMLT